jgi:hypothetical protein
MSSLSMHAIYCDSTRSLGRTYRPAPTVPSSPQFWVRSPPLTCREAASSWARPVARADRETNPLALQGGSIANSFTTSDITSSKERTGTSHFSPLATQF